MQSTFARAVRFGGFATLLSGVAALAPPASGAASAPTGGTGATGARVRALAPEPIHLGYAPPGMGSLAASTASAPRCPRVGHRQRSRDRRYRNPLAHARVTPERIDQGVDYSGTGSLTSIGSARIVYVGRENTGWPGAFIEYRLLDGNFAGRYVYYAEGVKPARGLRAGRRVRAGGAVAHLIRGWSTGIEIGWAAGIGTESLAGELREYKYPTRCGQSFSNFIQSLGGPPGQR